MILFQFNRFVWFHCQYFQQQQKLRKKAKQKNNVKTIFLEVNKKNLNVILLQSICISSNFITMKCLSFRFSNLPKNLIGCFRVHWFVLVISYSINWRRFNSPISGVFFLIIFGHTNSVLDLTQRTVITI